MKTHYRFLVLGASQFRVGLAIAFEESCLTFPNYNEAMAIARHWQEWVNSPNQTAAKDDK